MKTFALKPNPPRTRRSPLPRHPMLHGMRRTHQLAAVPITHPQSGIGSIYPAATEPFNPRHDVLLALSAIMFLGLLFGTTAWGVGIALKHAPSAVEWNRQILAFIGG